MNFNFLRTKPKKLCIVCNVSVGSSRAQLQYRYFEDDEAKIGTAFLCKKCADDMEKSIQVETDDG